MTSLLILNSQSKVNETTPQQSRVKLISNICLSMFFKYGQKGNVILFIYPMILFIRAKDTRWGVTESISVEFSINR